MKKLFTSLRYPGRFIIVGKDGGAAVAIFGATGRSPSSLARRFVEQGDGIYMAGVDATVRIQGNPDLLEYPAIKFFGNGVVAANGNHIDLITSLDNVPGAQEALSLSFGDEVTYEPDEYKTPRITGCVLETKDGLDAALHLVRSSASSADPCSRYWRVPIEDGYGSYIATYVGEDVRPTPSFSSEPIRVTLGFGFAEKAAEAAYSYLAPKGSDSDYRVGVVAVYKKRGEEPHFAIMNRFPS